MSHDYPTNDNEKLPQAVPEADLPAKLQGDVVGHNISIVDNEFKLYRDPAADQEWVAWEYLITGDDGEPYLGRNVKRELIDVHSEEPGDNPLWLGYGEDTNDGMREVGVLPDVWNEHFSIFGSTGKGKSTVIENFLVQVAHEGYGFCFQDPKGDTVQELVRQLPEHRKDDIIYIEPGSPKFDKVVGLNFLEPGSYDSEAEYNREVESIINDLIAVLKTGDYWGPLMEGITTNIARAMIRSERNYTLVDMYHVLLTQQSREMFADAVEREGFDEIRRYTRKIAMMDDEEVDAVMRRIQSWVENPIARSVVAHRESSINMADAIDQNKIILVNLDYGSDEIQQIIGTAVMRRIWSEMRKRGKMDEEDHDPFFAVFDEFHKLATEDIKIQEMLATARSANMPILVASQNPGRDQIPPNILEQIKSNTETMLLFALNNFEHAHELARRFGEAVDGEAIAQLDPYTAITQLQVEDDGRYVKADPFKMEIFAPHWPVRSEAEAMELLEENLDRYGVPEPKGNLNETEIILQQSAGNNELEMSFLEATWAEQLRAGGGPVAVGDLMDGFERRTGKRLSAFPDGIDVASQYIEVDRPNTDQSHQQEKAAKYETEGDNNRETIRQHQTEVEITAAGRQAVLEQDADRVQPSPVHRAILQRGFEDFSLLGMEVSVTRQVSEYGVNDATGYRPLEMNVDVTAVEETLQEYREQYPELAALTDCRQVSLEAEHSTISKPAHPIENLKRAFHNGQLAVFLVANGSEYGVAPETFAEDLESIFTDPPFVRDERFVLPGHDRDDPENHREEPVRILYNKSEKLELGQPDDDRTKYALVPQGEQSTWVDTGDGTLLLYGGSGEEAKQRGQIRTNEVKHASTNPFQFWCRWDRHNDEWIVYPDNGPEQRYENFDELTNSWTPVYQPLLPEVEFASRQDLAEGVPDDVKYPTEDDWMILPVTVDDLVDDIAGDQPTSDEGSPTDATLRSPATHD